ncbi:MAG: GDP-mannose 4,6-dehydratase [Candidatus Baltobacteraceae bacterium]
MNVLITGAGGFIGSHLTEAAVRRGLRVRAVVNYNSRGDAGHLGDIPDDIRNECDIRALDIRDAHGVDSLIEGMDAVFHLAALIGIPYSYVAPSSYVDVNIGGTLNLLNGARRHGIRRFVHTSTSEVYGSAQYVPIDERHPLVGQSPYSATKTGADQLAQSFALSFDVPVTIIRPFNTYGPRQSSRAVIPTLASQLLDASVRTVRAGTLTTERDFTFVTDTAAAYLHALDSAGVPSGAVINLGTGQSETISAIYEMLQEISGIRKPVEAEAGRVRPERSEVLCLRSDNRLAKELLDWQPSVSMRDGLRDVLAYLQSNPVRDAARYRV